uniref:ribonuclease E/G n=1 Tax=Agathobacter sp. TaxID=2021311 RepID=UPI0040569BF1
MNRLALTKVTLFNKNYIAYVLLDEQRKFVDFQLFENGTAMDSADLLNNIYIARVENIVSNINAAFVRISPEQKCWLSLEDLESPIFTKRLSEKNVLSIGDELMVQVIKDKVKTKDPVVSSKLTLSGTYCVLTTGNLTLSISKKIVGEKRAALQEVVKEIKPQADEHKFGVVLRTNAAEVPQEMVLADVQQAIRNFLDLKATGVHKAAFSVLVKEKAAYIRKLKSLDLIALDGIYTDDREIYENIKRELPYLEDSTFLRFYQDKLVSLKALYNIIGSIEELDKKKVWLKSGANIIIEQLETMTVIDVNSSKNISKNGHVLYEINKEAAVEIARQLRLRNISGMIIIDFINMKSKKQMQEVTECLKEALKHDPVPSDFIDVTKLGLVEVTRKKTYRSLKEVLH